LTLTYIFNFRRFRDFGISRRFVVSVEAIPERSFIEKLDSLTHFH